MSTDLNPSFDEQFININTKLKKRFMRKPNISEATNEFIALGIQCEHSEQPTFAGHAYIGAAKCEASAGNFLGEAEQYLTAARQFMKAEKKLHSLKFYSPDRENLEAAIGSYIQAIHKYPEKSILRASILIELAEGLVSLDHKIEAVSYFEQALECIEETTLKLMCMQHLLQLQIDCGKFEDAFDTANKIADDINNISEDVLVEIQIDRILLSLLVEPCEEGRPQNLKQLFVDLMNDTDVDSLPLNTDLKLNLQSIVVAHEISDASSLISIAMDTRSQLSTQQRNMLDVIVKKVAR